MTCPASHFINFKLALAELLSVALKEVLLPPLHRPYLCEQWMLLKVQREELRLGANKAWTPPWRTFAARRRGSSALGMLGCV